MKNALFIMRYFIDEKKDNLYTKFTGQIKAVEKLGYNVWYTGVSQNELYICNNKDKIKLIDLPNGKNGIISQYRFYNEFYKAVLKFLNDSNIDFDFTYARGMFISLSSIRLLKKLSKNNIKVIMEIPTHPAKNELKRYKNIFKRYLLLLINEMSRFFSKYVSLYTVIGEDCKKQYFGRKAINIENGVDIDSIPTRVPDINKDEIHILTLATFAKWHGYDRLIRGLYEYYYKNNGKEQIYIHMVGNDGDGSLTEWKKLTNELKLSNYVLFEGYLRDDKLNNIINKCDIAISSLGGHRINIYSTVEMKSREYMARGIPFVYATNDETLGNVPKYCFNVKNDDSNIDITSIVQFVKFSREDNTIMYDMKKYASTNMSWEKQFSKIIKEIIITN